MHFLTLVTVEIPKMDSEPEIDKRIQENIELLKENEPENNYLLRFFIESLNSRSTAFGRRVDTEISCKLEPYAEQTDNPDYLKFEDYTDELRKEYETGTVDCIKLPEGKIVSAKNRRVWNKFVVGDDGVVYQKYFGQLKHLKRSKRAKKMVAIKNFPYKKLYKTFDEFAQKERYFEYNEDYGGYGYLYNPDAFYDWYSIGGRWPFLFLVKDTCEEYSIGERSWGIHDQLPAPEGYRWVCAARKKDIQWKAMLEYVKESMVKRFHTLEKAFIEKKMPEGECGTFTDEGISRFGKMHYIKGETMQQYLARQKVAKLFKYPSFAYAYLDANGVYHDQDYIQVDDKNKRERIWHRIFNRFIASLDDETVLVGVDCHI